MIIANLFSFGGPDGIVILLIVLILFGSKKLPELARGMGQAIKEFNRAKDEFEREVTRPVADVAVQQPKDKQEFRPTLPAVPAETVPAKPATEEKPVA